MDLIKKSRTIECEVYKTSDGKAFEDKEKARLHQDVLDGNKKTCEHCKGKGTVHGAYVNEQQVRNELTCEYETILGYYESHTCPVCKGKGYLELKWI